MKENLNIHDIIRKNRTYRRFDSSRKLDASFIKEVIANARIAQSAANLQPLRYIYVIDDDVAGKVYECLGWAGYLKDWKGPEEKERPVAYIIVLADSTNSKFAQVDSGLAIQNMNISAICKGVGSCIFGSIKRKKLKEILGIDDDYEILYVVAFGYPVENVSIVEVKDSIKYYRDKSGNHYVPKRSLNEIILKKF